MASNNYRPPPQHYYPSSPPTRYASPTLSEQGSMRSMASPPPAYQQPYLNGYGNNNHYRPVSELCDIVLPIPEFSYQSPFFIY